MKYKEVNWIEFIFFPILLFSSFLVNIVFSLISNLFNTNIFSMFGQRNMAILSDAIINALIILLFVIFEKNINEQVKDSIYYIKKNITFLIFLFAFSKITTILINYIFKLVGINLNISKTENQLQIIDWIKEPNSFFMSLIIFLSITLIGPISEEILYRHLLIGEVGKILPYKVMAIISILLFAVIHILSAKSLLEILTYLVLAVPIVLSYLKSNFNVFVSISLHVFINITSYIYIYIYY
ncbi:MAG: type II CAAX endopeptidase family protein [Staphylococcus warneri]|nr:MULTISPECIES: type II CAAX endopeptidase family protein [Staphylococcus]MDU0852703.1 type II CAAX endopeptidase family protein [Veillonella sp.]MDU1711332.1 type II CAAX endopeptidase family protein [Staphylococcus epidermidis]MDU1788567.1 type II CAAX endopeptidase family protein [Streptococcus thermophilus]MDU1965214.1 type II CAAX endopeptidase family protein [Staphylococcus lugdunensis]MDU2291052.1 type II CAAX endopeptidase family protein [Clostridium celatum]MDU7073404.1 type II CAAX